jgi:hypothetical protein
MRRATSQMIHQSARASPGGGRKARWREMRRSELVTVPSFSPQASAGRRMCAWRTVSVSAMQSDTTTHSQRSSARRTWSLSGRLTTGLVAMIHSAFTSPRSTARNRSTALSPALDAIRGACQKRCTSARCSAFSSSMCAASWLASPPTSRPPMALGWPVIEKGPAPGWPMRPVSEMAVDDRVALVGAAAGLVDALREQRDDARRDANHSKKRATSSDSSAQPAATASGEGAYQRACARASSKPLGVGGQVGVIHAFVLFQPGQQAVEQQCVAARTQGQVQVGVLAAGGAARVDHHQPQRGPGALARPGYAGTAPGDTRPGWTPPGRPGRPARGPRNCSAPSRCRRRACTPPPPRPCTGGELVSMLAEPMKPFISLLAT